MRQADPRQQARQATQREPHDAMAWIMLAEVELEATSLAAVRAELVARRRDSGLFDMDAFAADFADAMRTMARKP